MDITVTFKFFSGIDKQLTVQDYDPSKGISLTVPKGTRLRTVLKNLGLQKLSTNAYFRQGERMGAWSKLQDNDEVSVLRPAGGG